MFEVRPFAFDRRFSATPASHAQASRIELEMEVESFKAQLERMEKERQMVLAQARADGFEAGLAHARTERETALLAAVDALQAGVEQLAEEFESVATSVTRDAADVALAAADLLAGRAIEAAPAAAIDEALGRVLQQVGRGPRLLIRVNPGVVEEMERIVAERIANERRRMTLNVVGDPTLALGDAAIVWDEGGLSLDAVARRAMIEEELGGLLPR